MNSDQLKFDSIRQAFMHTELSTYSMWVIYYSLGGTATSDEVDAYLLDEGDLEIGQEWVLAQSVNEVFLDADSNHPAPYPRAV
jgi:hypothetical protein